MDRPCHHHPDKEAAGTCCYCDRPLCAECLFTNRQGKTFCIREEECLAYQDALLSPAGPASPVVDWLIDEATLDAQVRRASEILEELGEMKALFEDIEANEPPGGPPAGETEPSHPFEGDSRIPSYCAGRLLEEALALLDLISFRVEFIQKDPELCGSSGMLERAKEVRAFLEQEAEPKIRAHRDWAGRSGELDRTDLLDRKQEG